MQAIITTIIPATKTKPTRIKAVCKRGKLVMSINSLPDIPTGTNTIHRQIAQKLCDKFRKEDHPQDYTWHAPFVTGQLPNGDYVHVFIT